MLTNYWNVEFGYTGNTYFIPTDAKNWLGYTKAIVDDGASWVQSADLSWQGLEVLPDTWPGGGGVGVYKNAALALIFSNDSSAVYHDLTLAAGYGSGPTAQPTADYKDDYDAMVDMLTGTQTSFWAQNLNITQNQFPDGLSIILYPMVVNGSGGADAANILQMISGYTAELIPPSKYGIPTAVDVTSYILQGVSGTMPYTGSTTPSNTITQLFEKNDLGMLALLDQEYSTQVFGEIKDGVSNLKIKVLVPVTSLCPCSKKISSYGAHNQRSHVTVTASIKDFIWIEEIIDIVEKEASSELYALLKRPDEKHVTELAYDNPKFVEDMVRDIASHFSSDDRIIEYIIESENFESIHNHSAYAQIHQIK